VACVKRITDDEQGGPRWGGEGGGALPLSSHMIGSHQNVLSKRERGGVNQKSVPHLTKKPSAKFLYLLYN
jgi:hypothetical protein